MNPVWPAGTLGACKHSHRLTRSRPPRAPLFPPRTHEYLTFQQCSFFEAGRVWDLVGCLLSHRAADQWFKADMSVFERFMSKCRSCGDEPTEHCPTICPSWVGCYVIKTVYGDGWSSEINTHTVWRRRVWCSVTLSGDETCLVSFRHNFSSASLKGSAGEAAGWRDLWW